MDGIDRVGPVTAWVVTLLVGLLTLGGGAVLAPGAVWDRFLWRHFWGPVYAEANNAACAINDGGSVSPGGSGFEQSCSAAVESGAIVVDPQLSVVAEVGYALAGLFVLTGLYLLATRLYVGHDRKLVYALLPFVAFGGVLRVVEDASEFVYRQALREGSRAEVLVEYPLSALLVSPIIYVTVLVVTLVALLSSIALSRRDLVESYHRTLAGAGTVLLTVTLAGLVVLAMSTDSVSFFPSVFVVALLAASVLAGGLFAATDRLAPRITAGTGYVGLAVLWAHALGGVTSVLIIDWADAFGLGLLTRPSHPITEFVVRATESVQPGGVTAAIGATWPYLLLKLGVAWAVVWLFTEAVVDERPRFAHLLLVVVIVVGLGPGTRALVRATFGL